MASSSRRLRQQLVAGLRDSGRLVDERLARSFELVPREEFLPASAATGDLASVYADRPIVVKRDEHNTPISSSSQPAIMASMLELLGVHAGDHVLEIGTATGYNAAILARLVGRHGRVTSVELDEELAEHARAVLKTRFQNVEVVTGDGFLGCESGAPYDGVIVTASADAPPRSWHEQLRPGGRLVMPLRFNEGGAGLPLRQCVVAFEGTEAGFRSVAMVPGGFMPMRRPGETARSEEPPPSLSLRDAATGEARFCSVAGHRLRQMGPAARTRLLSLLLTRPRRSPLRGSADFAWQFDLALRGDEFVSFVSSLHGGESAQLLAGTGLLSASGRGAAFLVREQRRAVILSFGEAAPLAERLAERHEHASPATVSVWYESAPPRTATVVSRSGDATVTVG